MYTEIITRSYGVGSFVYSARLRNFVVFFDVNDPSRKILLGESLIGSFFIILIISSCFYLFKRDGVYLTLSALSLGLILIIKINML